MVTRLPLEGSRTNWARRTDNDTLGRSLMYPNISLKVADDIFRTNYRVWGTLRGGVLYSLRNFYFTNLILFLGKISCSRYFKKKCELMKSHQQEMTQMSEVNPGRKRFCFFVWKSWRVMIIFSKRNRFEKANDFPVTTLTVLMNYSVGISISLLRFHWIDRIWFCVSSRKLNFREIERAFS